MTANPDVDHYVERSELWPQEIDALRPILRDSGLTEEIKWRKPCYTHDGANIAIVQEMKNFVALMFFKGALLDDPDGVLESQGPNSRSARRMCFTSVDDVRRLAATVRAYVAEAIDVDKAGIALAPTPELILVDELRDRLERDAELRTAFEALTPGRRREYNLYFADAKQASTRTSRIDKYADKILAGKGFRDR